LRVAGGATYLIDWDSVAIAPRERDLWQLLDEPVGSVWDAYARTAGCVVRKPRRAAMQMFRLWWRLAEIGEYVRQLREPHDGNADDEAAWDELREYVEPGSGQCGQ
jgi:spectinomycin phosphotransferase